MYTCYLFQVYVSPWCPSYSDEQRHRHCIRRLTEWPRLSPDQKFDERMAVLFLAVLGFDVPPPPGFPLGSGSRSRGTVDRVQQKYALLPHRYLKSVCGDAEGTAKFGAGVALIGIAREAYEMHSNMLPF